MRERSTQPERVDVFSLLKTEMRQYAMRWVARRTPRTAHLKLAQSQVYVMPTGAGVGMLVTLGLMLLAAMNYNLALGYAFTFLLAGAGLAHLLQSWRTLVGLEVSIGAEDEVFVGQQAWFRVSLHNPHLRARPAIALIDEHGTEHARVDVLATSTASARVGLPALQRGRLQPAVIVLETRQPLGWVRAWSHARPSCEHIVYPRPLNILPLPSGLGNEGDTQSSTTRDGDDFAGMREFRAGDSLRHVAWKSLARGQGLLTKVFEGYQSPDVCLDYAELPADMDVETRLSQLAHWIVEARQAGLRTRLLLPDGELGPASHAAHHRECLIRLALFGEEVARAKA